jgi:hypothetical protein
MTHAIQAEAFPELFKQASRLQTRSIERLEKFFQAWDLAELPSLKNAAKEDWERFFPVSILLEGHAKWVETAAEKSLLAQEKSRMLDYRYWLYALDQATASFDPDNIVYFAGYNLVAAVHAVQEEMEKLPFRDYEGRMVTLAPTLQGDGMLRLVFQHTQLVDLMLPNVRTALLPWNRAKVDVQAFRSLIVRMPGHTPL